MKKLSIVTTTRAEYGLLKPVIEKFRKDKDIELSLVVTGAHLCAAQGNTVSDIEKDGIGIDKRISILSGDSDDTSVVMANALKSFSEYFATEKPEALMVLGDRFETMAICIAAYNRRIPIIHIHGGETTEGAVDEAYRHSITKMSQLHFPATSEYRKRIIQLGENPDNVYCVGALGVENAGNIETMSYRELEESIGIELGEKYAVGTFHPVTLENSTAAEQINELLSSIEEYKDIHFIFTKANLDSDGDVINKSLEDFAADHENFHLVGSLGVIRYMSALKGAAFVIGNSSSGIIEAPAFGIPTINIGDRQKGRTAGKTVINCEPVKEEIKRAIDKAMSQEFLDSIKDAVNPYGAGNTSDKIVQITKKYMLENSFNLKKKFYDLPDK
ncbi:UDP-N-acetylglucosamine 2-epimerase [Butyrivibrio sp. AE3006]|uniref:UDP-N-acetylglucosamine 2-epimerase n=1 Tax=Butyrivibrio sp. AE3006 TaxID=1280673 RepID=UPI0003FF7560|nr:UDP-N-acetylglucosamine 2-epimerase [Butyrivibrio sp. AE3006]